MLRLVCCVVFCRAPFLGLSGSQTPRFSRSFFAFLDTHYCCLSDSNLNLDPANTLCMLGSQPPIYCCDPSAPHPEASRGLGDRHAPSPPLPFASLDVVRTEDTRAFFGESRPTYKILLICDGEKYYHRSLPPKTSVILPRAIRLDIFVVSSKNAGRLLVFGTVGAGGGCRWWGGMGPVAQGAVWRTLLQPPTTPERTDVHLTRDKRQGVDV